MKTDHSSVRLHRQRRLEQTVDVIHALMKLQDQDRGGSGQVPWRSR
jgi:hypothetical protein